MTASILTTIILAMRFYVLIVLILEDWGLVKLLPRQNCQLFDSCPQQPQSSGCTLTKMPMRLRLAVHGTRNDRIFHLVAINQRLRRNGKPTELLGIYDPRLKPGGRDYKTMEWSVGRIRYWLDVGAIPSKSVVKLLEMGNILKPGSPYHPKASTANGSATPTPSL